MKSRKKKHVWKAILLFKSITLITILSAFLTKDETPSNFNFKKYDVKEQKTLNQIFPSKNSDQQITYVTINLNVKNQVSLTAGEASYFTYTPESDFYYVLETYGTLETTIQVSNTYNGTINNDDSESNINAKVEFRGIRGTPIYIKTTLSNSNVSGNYTIQLRKQRASLFGYEDYEGNSTISDLNIPYTQLSPIFETIKYENTSARDALSNDDRYLSKINSEIMFFSGHGYKSSPTEKGNGVAFKNGGISTNTTINMDRTKVAMWAACYSANSTNSKNLSIAEYSVKNGAKASVGFLDSVSFSSSKTFTNRFFSKLSEGATVKEAASFGASGLVWPWDNGKNYVIFGNDSVKITESTPSISSISLKSINTNILDELMDVSVVDLDQNSKRYYEKINGKLTNSFVDITYNNYNKIVDIKDYRKNLNRYVSINNAYLKQGIDKTIISDETIYQLNEEISRNIVYIFTNNVMTPIEITTANYTNNGIIREEITCINLTNGQKLDYSQINSF